MHPKIIKELREELGEVLADTSMDGYYEEIDDSR